MGPFKHKVDIAIPLRKTSLGVFSTALENCPTCLDIDKFMPILASALSDIEDIKLQAHQILITVCANYPHAVASAVDSFVDPLQKSADVHLRTMRKNANKSDVELERASIELERANESIKSGLRAMLGKCADF